MNYVVESYENYREEDRLTTNNARKIEFITTTRILNEILGENLKILDCAAGTGIYSFYLADRGHNVTATDITPRHIEMINNKLKSKSYKMDTAVLDATDMSIFPDNSFDVVLNMGPFYHLTDENQREKCFSESLRVLKKYVALSDKKYIDSNLAEQLITTGVLKHTDEKCFWTDTYYSTDKEMEKLYLDNNVKIIDHFAQDGLTPLFADKIDSWKDDEFKIWCDYHYSICREKSILGASNHVIIVGEKI